MSIYPDYLVYAAHFHPDNKERIDKLKVFFHYDPDKRGNHSSEMTKEQLIECIKKGETCYTAKKDSGRYYPQKKIYVVSLFGNDHVKIHKDEDSKDNLGSLELF
ncbi:MAG: DUF3892 domain-containing protein [Spirochaetia bacterium]|nr:DUF3892 domain-containing protein [Spirochaetia bacterium]MCF7953813.1 DUF3892 domain-containing protein [Spirochaetales bacterium]